MREPCKKQSEASLTRHCESCEFWKPIPTGQGMTHETGKKV